MGLFEDDANVRPQPKKPKPKAATKKVAAKPSGMAARMLEKVEGRADLVGMAGSGNVIDFAKVDVSPLRKKKAAKKEDDGKLSPPINYVKD